MWNQGKKEKEHAYKSICLLFTKESYRHSLDSESRMKKKAMSMWSKNLVLCEENIYCKITPLLELELIENGSFRSLAS